MTDKERIKKLKGFVLPIMKYLEDEAARVPGHDTKILGTSEHGLPKEIVNEIKKEIMKND